MSTTVDLSPTFYSLTVYKKIIETLTGADVQGNAIANATQYFKPIAFYESDRFKTQQFFCFMESTANIDAYQSTDSSQTYRILLVATVTNQDTAIDASNNYKNYDNVITDLTMYVGTSQQIYTPVGTLAANIATTMPTIMPGTLSMPLFSGLTSYYNQSVDLGLKMNMTSRGFSFALYQSNTINSMPGTSSTNANTMFVIQRPVSPSDGSVNTSGNAPVFMLAKSCNSSNSGFNFAVIREKDINTSTAWVDTSTVSSSVFYKFTSDWAHPNLFDNMTHVIKFPFGFCTTRHLYMEELDLMCMVNATAFVGNQDLNITMYGETTPRTYTTIFGQLVFGGLSSTGGTLHPVTELTGGSRIGLLTAGGGI